MEDKNHKPREVERESGEETPPSNQFENLLETFEAERPRRGQLLQGRILRIEEDAILMDVGAKRDALILRKELGKLEDEQLEAFKPGDEIPVYVLRTPVGDEALLVSAKRGLELEDWEYAEECLQKGEVLDLTVTGWNRGGVLVEFKQLQGFIPNSHIPELDRGASKEQRREFKQNATGTQIRVKVIEVDRKHRRLILSGRAADKEKRLAKLRELKVGETRKGRVVHLEPYGAFVDLGGVDGLVHISELDHRKVEHPSQIVDVGEMVEVQIEKVDAERERVSLSRKALLPDPWGKMEERYVEGDIVEGEVTNVEPFGAFVVLENGIEGLIHESEIGILGAVDPSEFIHPGESVIVRILSIDPGRRRVGLSLSQVSYVEQMAWKQEREANDAGE